MDFLISIASWIGDQIAWVLEQVTGWRPDERAKTVLDWAGSLTSAFLGLWGVVALIRGKGHATKADIDMLRREVREEFHKVLAAREASGPVPGGGQAPATPPPSLTRDIDAAIDTLLAAGKGDALRDTSGAQAEAALDQLIAEKSTARGIASQEEAALWRQKGALAFLHDTKKALAAYGQAARLDPDDADGWNNLGHLLVRAGDLDQAIKAYERVMALGNSARDQATIAAATGNLGNVFRTRGDL
ncbi:MAG: tetratricopeptide repeat protein, partial [Hyphomicrobium sp.]